MLRLFANTLKKLAISTQVLIMIGLAFITLIGFTCLAWLVVHQDSNTPNSNPPPLVKQTHWLNQSSLGKQLMQDPDMARRFIETPLISDAYQAVLLFQPKGQAYVGQLADNHGLSVSPSQLRNWTLQDWRQQPGLTYQHLALKHQGRIIGHLLWVARPLANRQPWQDLLIVSALSLLFCLPLLLLIANRLRQQLSQPLDHLQKITQEISQVDDYSRRLPDSGSRDIQQLVNGINQLLDKFVARDQLLTDERDKAKRASLRAISLSEQTREINTQLKIEVDVRTRIEKQLTDFQQYLNNIINSMPSALIAVDDQFIVSQWNKEASALSGIPVEDALNQPLEEVFPFLAQYVDFIARALKQKQSEKIEKVAINLNQQSYVFDLVIYPLLSSTSRGAVIRIDDVSQRLQMEEVMVQTEKMMSVGGLAAGMAHEINNPLGAIIQSVQNIKRRLSSNLAKNQETAAALNISIAEIQDYLRQRNVLKFLDGIQEAGERAATIVTNMLQFSRSADSRLEPCDLTLLIQRAIDIASNDYNLADGYDFKHIHLHTDFADSLTEVPLVASEIEQVLINLLKNAAQALQDYQPEPRQHWHPSIEIHTQRSGEHAIIRIKDNGPGMPEHVRKRIFEPFFTTKDVGFGTGLGLSVSYFIISSHHHGSMEVHSRLGQGTLFTIRLPANNRHTQALAL